MRKTILIGLVAIAMLFAFTACDNTPTWTNATVSDVSLASSPDYLTGEVIDPSQVMLSITSVDGKVTTRSAAGAIAVGTVADADTALSVKVGGETFSIYLPVYAADALVIDGSASTYTQTVGSQAQAALNGDNVLDGLKYTVEYAKGTKEVPASAVTGVSVATDTANVVGTAKVRLGQSADVKVYGTKVSDVTIENWNVTITAATEAPATSFTAALTTKIDVALDEDATLWYDDTASEAIAKFVITATDSNNFSSEVTGSVFIVKDGASVTGNTALNTTKNVDVYATYVAGGKTFNAKISVPVNDYINAIKATLPEGYTVADFGTLDTTKLTVKGRLASCATQTGTDDKEFTETITDFDVNKTLITGSSDRTVTVSTTYKVQDPTEPLKTTVNVAAPASSTDPGQGGEGGAG